MNGYIVEKSKELPRQDKFHGLSRDSEYKTLTTMDGLGYASGWVPMTEGEKLYVESLPQVIRVVSDETIGIPTPPAGILDAPRIMGRVGLDLHRIPQLWNQGLYGEGVNAWVLDTGVDDQHAHSTFQNNLKGIHTTVGGLGFDINGHGTWCCGAMACPGSELGTAPKVNLHSCQVLGDDGSGSYSTIIAGIDLALRNKANVISLSLGGPGSPDSPLSKAVDTAFSKGVFVAVAAGNDGCSGNPSDKYTPASSVRAMAVAACDINKAMASFSSCGVAVDITFIGVKVRNLGLNGALDAYLSGTSMATPHAAGLGALLMGEGHTADEIWKHMKMGAVDLGFSANQQGAGLGDAVNTLNLLRQKNSTKPAPTIQRMSLSSFCDGDKTAMPDKFIITMRRKDYGVLTRSR